MARKVPADKMPPAIRTPEDLREGIAALRRLDRRRIDALLSACGDVPRPSDATFCTWRPVPSASCVEPPPMPSTSVRVSASCAAPSATPS